MRTFFATILVVLLTAVGARADMSIAPLRQVLTADVRAASFTVSNPSDRMLEGRISWLDLLATEKGYAPAPKEHRQKLSAAPFLIISPAQFRLEPGGKTEIEVRLREGARIPKGERRSHLLIETAASRTPIRKASDSGLQVDIGVGISAPVILRGNGKARASFSDTRLVRDSEGLLALETAIEAQSAYSSYGRVALYFTPNDTGEQRLLGVRENIAGYPDAARRLVEIPIGYLTLDSGELTISYEGAAEYAGRTFDTRTFEVAPPE